MESSGDEFHSASENEEMEKEMKEKPRDPSPDGKVRKTRRKPSVKKAPSDARASVDQKDGSATETSRDNKPTVEVSALVAESPGVTRSSPKKQKDVKSLFQEAPEEKQGM
jgi:hypothetical protein